MPHRFRMIGSAMLQSLTLTNFKSFAGDPQTVPFGPVTVFVGANGSGKSNVFDALRVLHGIGNQMSMAQILSHPRSSDEASDFGIRGGVAEVCWNSSQKFALSSVSLVRDERQFWEPFVVGDDEFDRIGHFDEPVRLRHDVTVATAPTLRVSNESLELISPTEDVEPTLVSYNEMTQGVAPYPVAFRVSRTPLSAGAQTKESSLLLPAARIGMSYDGRSLVKALLANWSEFLFFHFDLGRMREYTPQFQSSLPAGLFLANDGSNLSTVLEDICERENDRDRLLEWISDFGGLRIRGIEFEKTQFGEMMFQLIEGETHRRVSARSVSDGTIRFLGVLAALFNAPEQSLLLFEELENGLHPTRINVLVELFEQFADERNIQIIATTHSPQVLLGLSESALRNAVLFARNEEHPGTVVRRLGDLEHFDEVTKKTRIDELFSTGWLEFAV